MLTPLAIALQGISFSAAQVAAQGLYPEQAPVGPIVNTPSYGAGGAVYSPPRRPYPAPTRTPAVAALANDDAEIIDILTITVIAIEAAGLWEA
ncbi:MAG: hypothetical protein ACRC2H_01510 [Silanimonas sp.]